MKIWKKILQISQYFWISFSNIKIKKLIFGKLKVQKLKFGIKKFLDHKFQTQKKSDALVGRVYTFHILRTSNFFQKDPKSTSRNFKTEKALKTLLKSSFTQISALQNNFDIFSRKYPEFSGNHLSEFQKILNLSMQFHT
jgi:hypothetical protein